MGNGFFGTPEVGDNVKCTVHDYSTGSKREVIGTIYNIAYYHGSVYCMEVSIPGETIETIIEILDNYGQ